MSPSDVVDTVARRLAVDPRQVRVESRSNVQQGDLEYNIPDRTRTEWTITVVGVDDFLERV